MHPDWDAVYGRRLFKFFMFFMEKYDGQYHIDINLDVEIRFWPFWYYFRYQQKLAHWQIADPTLQPSS